MKATKILGSLLAFVFAGSVARALTIPTVPVGNPGNLADIRYDPNGIGSVGYNFRVAKYEVTNSNYVEFLNAVDPSGTNTLALYGSLMSSDASGGIIFTSGASTGSKYSVKPGRDNNPVVAVSWYDAIRFANWLHNGQGSGDTETGAYTLLGGTPTPSNGDSITRNPGATWWLPSEDEWYKAAYHKNDGATGNYWDYATSTSTVPYSAEPPGSDAPDASNAVNSYWDDDIANGYNDGYAATGSKSLVSSQNYLTDVGAYTLALSPYGTFDQSGNVWEWNEKSMTFSSLGPQRGLSGGSWGSNRFTLPAFYRNHDYPSNAYTNVGFRVATLPEPTGIALCVTGLVILLLRKRGAEMRTQLFPIPVLGRRLYLLSYFPRSGCGQAPSR
jgi:formylglycine-generating enzyme required for sulfatase activity